MKLCMCIVKISSFLLQELGENSRWHEPLHNQPLSCPFQSFCFHCAVVSPKLRITLWQLWPSCPFQACIKIQIAVSGQFNELVQYKTVEEPEKVSAFVFVVLANILSFTLTLGGQKISACCYQSSTNSKLPKSSPDRGSIGVVPAVRTCTCSCSRKQPYVCDWVG